MSKVYIVVFVEDYDSFEVSYHKTKKGAYREIMRRQYENWTLCRYVNEYDMLYFTVYEKDLKE